MLLTLEPNPEAKHLDGSPSLILCQVSPLGMAVSMAPERLAAAKRMGHLSVCAPAQPCVLADEVANAPVGFACDFVRHAPDLSLAPLRGGSGMRVSRRESCEHSPLEPL